MREIVEADFGNWQVKCIPEDGARISVLKYAGYDLLTSEQPSFKPPDKFHGEYETRPVYGYDDCFPSVDPCIYPDEQYECRDHGEICWQKWQVETKGDSLECFTDCLKPEANFKRILEFERDKLIWRFEVINSSNKKLPFLHVMHALLPLDNIQSLKLPGFRTLKDEAKSVDMGFKKAHELADDLLAVPSGSHKMLLLKNIDAGSVKLGFKNDMTLLISFDINLYRTIGIWWNNAGYPEEAGLQRTECAFEPIPGTCSDLSKSFRDGVSLMAEPGKTLTWEINWTIEHIDNIN